MIRKIVGIVVGVLLAILVTALLEMVINYALAPAGIDPSDPEGMRRMMEAMPASAFLAVLLTYFLATLAGAFIAARIAREDWTAWSVAGVVLLLTLINVVSLPHPLWFVVGAVALIGGAGWLAGRLALGGFQPVRDGSGDGASYGGDAGRSRNDHDGWDGGDGGGDGGGD